MESVVHWADDVLCRGPRDVVLVEGADAERYLQSQLAQDITAMIDGESRWSLLLEPDGKVVSLLRVSRSGDQYLLSADPMAGEPTARRLQRFLLRVDVSLAVIPADAEIGDDLEADRIAHGWPRHDREILPGATLPAELGLTASAVSFTKGCYPGQELVERMDSRGSSAPYRIVVIDEPLPVGSDVIVDGDTVGQVTSAGSGRSLARVKRGVDIGRPAPTIGS